MSEISEYIRNEREVIIDDLSKVGIMQAGGIKWAVHLSENIEKAYRHVLITYYPEIIQMDDDYAVWFKFKLSYKEKYELELFKILKKLFEELHYKPVFNKNILRNDARNMWELMIGSYFTKSKPHVIRDTHPLYRNVVSSFFISTEYPSLILEAPDAF